jgi:hypothetical protein
VVLTIVVGLSAQPAEAHGDPASAPTPLINQERTPSGWTSHAYASALIAAPPDWTVERNDPCPSSQAAGLLVLGEPFGVSCPMDRTPASMVVLNTFADMGTASALTQPAETVQRVHGVGVELGNDDPPAVSTLWAPSLGLSVSWSGPDARNVVSTLRPLEPRSLSSACREAAVRMVIPELAKEIGASGLTIPSGAAAPWSPTAPGVSSDFTMESPEFAALVTAGLQVFDGLVSDDGTAAFYSSTLQPSRRVVESTPRCHGQMAGIETLTASVSSHLLGPPWQMVAVTEPGWNGGALFFRGNCPGGVQPTKTTAACDTASVVFETGSTAPSKAVGSLRAQVS